MFSRGAKPGGDKHRAKLVTVQPNRVRLVVQPRTADMRRRRVVEKIFFDRIPVEPGNGAQPPGDGGRARPLASRSRAKHSMSARRAWNKRR